MRSVKAISLLSPRAIDKETAQSFGITKKAFDNFLLVNRNSGNVAYMRHFSNHLRPRVNSVIMFWSQFTYDGDYESSVLALQHRSFNHPRSLKCEGAVRLPKYCLYFIFFSCTICLFVFDHQHQPWRPPTPTPAS